MVEFARYEDASGSRVSAEEMARAWHVRSAEPADLAVLAQLSAHREGMPLERSRRKFERLFKAVAEGTADLLVADAPDSRAPVGFAVSQLVDPAYVERFYASLGVPPPERPEGPPNGWYLLGIVVDADHRRRGMGHALTRDRVLRLFERVDRVYYFANSRNRVSIQLHEAFGFVEARRPFTCFPGVQFEDGEGVLFVARRAAQGPHAPRSSSRSKATSDLSRP